MILCDQFNRLINLKSAKAYALDHLTRTIIIKMLTSERETRYKNYRCMEKWLMLLCLLRSEKAEDVQQCVDEYSILAESSFNEGLDAICDISKYGKDLALQYLELLQTFGRNPFKNSLLGRGSSIAETDYIINFQNE